MSPPSLSMMYTWDQLVSVASGSNQSMENLLAHPSEIQVLQVPVAA